MSAEEIREKQYFSSWAYVPLSLSLQEEAVSKQGDVIFNFLKNVIEYQDSRQVFDCICI